MEYLPMVFAQAVRELQNSGIGGGCQFKGRFTRKSRGERVRIGKRHRGARGRGEWTAMPEPGAPGLKQRGEEQAAPGHEKAPCSC